VLLKVASSCNLNCSYCYVYHMGDETWRTLPKRMSAETETAVADQLGALLKAQARPFSIVLHGGEPLLLGSSRLRGLLARLRSALSDECSISIQTNGVLISNAILEICSVYGVSLSVSLDGPAVIHDKFRVDLRERPSHKDVLRGLAKLKSHPRSPDLFSGVLAVVEWNIREDCLADITASAEFRAYHDAQRPTSATCRDCALLKVCGGGMLTHRFKAGSGYDNPTIFCADQTLLIDRMRTHIADYHRIRETAA